MVVVIYEEKKEKKRTFRIIVTMSKALVNPTNLFKS